LLEASRIDGAGRSVFLGYAIALSRTTIAALFVIQFHLWLESNICGRC